MSRFFVEDYFASCPCCGTQAKEILLSEAKSFKKFHWDWTETLYTSAHCYEAHLPMIKEWQQQVDGWERSLRLERQRTKRARK
jgi:hypothetical protein